jgi:hypothetical protein
MERQHTHSHLFSSEELSEYREKGYLVREKVFDAREIEDLVANVEKAVDSIRRLIPSGKTYHLDGNRFVDIGNTTVQFEHASGSPDIRVIEPVSGLDMGLDRLMESPRIVQPIRSILETDRISLWTNKLNLKARESGSGFDWHQDSPYWVYDSDDVDNLPNVYLAFDEANRENGCLRVIESSHKSGCLPGRDDGTQLGGFFTDRDHIRVDAEVLLEVPAGSLVFFDPHLIHGSRSNMSKRQRRALVMTYQRAGLPMLKTGEINNVEGSGIGYSQ